MAECKVVGVRRLGNRAIGDEVIEKDWSQNRALRHTSVGNPPAGSGTFPRNARLMAAKVRGRPSNEIRMEICRGNGVQEKRMVDHLEGFADVDGDGCCSKRRLSLVESRSDLVDEREQGSGCRVVGPKPMLSRSELERGLEEG